MSNIVHEARKTSVDNAETMQEIRIAIENLGDNFQKMQEKILQWDEPEQFMDTEEERVFNENISTLLKEVSLPLADQNISVSTPQVSVAMAGPSGVDPSTTSTNAVPEIFQSRPIDVGNFGGLSFPGNFSTPASVTLPYLGLDGHPRRITPIPTTPTLSQPSALNTPKSPEQLQREASELIQRLEKEESK